MRWPVTGSPLLSLVAVVFLNHLSPALPQLSLFFLNSTFHLHRELPILQSHHRNLPCPSTRNYHRSYPPGSDFKESWPVRIFHILLKVSRVELRRCKRKLFKQQLRGWMKTIIPLIWSRVTLTSNLDDPYSSSHITILLNGKSLL